MITKEECQKRLLKELKKRTGKQDMTKSLEAVRTETRIMQKILDDNPSWGYKIIIDGDNIMVTSLS